MKIYQEFDKHWIKDESTGCWLWQRAICAKGYGHLYAPNGLVYAHRYSWQRAKGDIPSGMQVLHRCDNRKCVNPEHLFIGSNYDNIRDMMLKGRQQRGESHVKAVLTDAQVLQIRALHGKKTLREIAKLFAVSHSTICDIVHGKTRREAA